MRLAVALLPSTLLTSLLLTGCGIESAGKLSPSSASLNISGVLHGGSQPIVGAHMYLLAANPPATEATASPPPTSTPPSPCSTLPTLTTRTQSVPTFSPALVAASPSPETSPARPQPRRFTSTLSVAIRAQATTPQQDSWPRSATAAASARPPTSP
jgi:hypothetical protein